MCLASSERCDSNSNRELYFTGAVYVHATFQLMKIDNVPGDRIATDTAEKDSAFNLFN